MKKAHVNSRDATKSNKISNHDLSRSGTDTLIVAPQDDEAPTEVVPLAEIDFSIQLALIWGSSVMGGLRH